MKALSNYIKYLTNIRCDGHIHLFSHRGSIFENEGFSIPENYKKIIGFMDVEFGYLNKYSHDDVIGYYDKFIQDYYDPSKMLLMATGTDSQTAIDLHKKYPNIIKGFGEFKCYEDWVHGKLPFGNLKWIEEVCEYNLHYRLPIYIHWNLRDEEHLKKLDELLRKYPTTPFVLCHCGMDDSCDNDWVYEKIKKLPLKYPNLYVDISYSATNYFIKNKKKLKYISPSRTLLGSDLNPILKEHDDPTIYEKEYKKLGVLSKYLNGNLAYSSLFIS